MTQHFDDLPPRYDVSWDEAEQVVRFVWAPGSICTVAQARAGSATIRALDKGTVPMLVDMRRMKKLEREARELYKTDKGGVSAMALLVGSPVTKMLANFFMRTDTDTTPTRMFTDESVALNWLHEQRA
jgi:hypothetical protein